MKVWDYGVDRTYATPQAAFDACQLANGGAAPAAFTENEYIRGFGVASYGGPGAGEPPLRLIASAGAGAGFGCLPTSTFRLYIDVDPAATVLLNDDQNAACIIGSNIAGTRVNNHVIVDRKLQLQAVGANSSGYGIIINQDRTGGELAYDWIVRCEAVSDLACVVCGSTVNLSLDGPDLHSYLGNCVYCDGSAGTYGVFYGIIKRRNCKLQSQGQTIYLRTGDVVVSGDHNTHRSELSSLIYIWADSAATYGSVLINNNNIYQTKAAAQTCIVFVDFNFTDVQGNGNCYDYDPAGAVASIQGTPYSTLADWQAVTSEDEDSFMADPLLNSDLSLSDNSPARRRGRTIPPLDINGQSRDPSFADCGAVQTTRMYTAADLLVIGHE